MIISVTYKRLNIFDKFKVNVEHIPTSIDSFGVIVESKAVEKIVYDNLMAAFFQAFCIIDGVGDPDESLMEPNEIWLGFKLTDIVYNGVDDVEEEFTEFLHDEFYSTYEEWKASQKNSNFDRLI